MGSGRMPSGGKVKDGNLSERTEDTEPRLSRPRGGRRAFPEKSRPSASVCVSVGNQHGVKSEPERIYMYT